MAQFLGPFADLTRRLGGEPGRHSARPAGPASLADRITPGLAAIPVFFAATFTWLVLMIRQLPCRQSDVNVGVETFKDMCYTDITVLYLSRGQAGGGTLYWDIDWEYPVLSGYFAELANRLAGLLGFAAGPDLDGQTQLNNANVYFALNVVMLFVCFLVLVAVERQLLVTRPMAVFGLAVSPAIMTAAVINWDLLAVMLTALGLLAVTQQKPTLAGIWFGLAVAAKFYPLVILGGLFALAVRPLVRAWLYPKTEGGHAERDRDELRQFGRLLGVAIITWLAANLPLLLTSWEGWAYFYTFNQNRGPDFGSPWYALNLVGFATPNAQTWAMSLMLVGYAAIALVTVLAPVRPRLGQVAFLCVALMVSLNMVYSPQYVLWTLPLLVLARPVWADIAAYTVAELGYFAAIWMYLASNPWVYVEKETVQGQPIAYSVVTLFRVAVTWWIMGVVTRDIWRPRHDPARAERDFTFAQRVTYGLTASGEWVDAPVRMDSGRPLFHPAKAVTVAVTGFLFSRAVLIFLAVVIGKSSGQSGVEAMNRWDVGNFIKIAESGYTSEPNLAAFFPGLPLLLRAGFRLGLSYTTTGFIVSLVCSAFVAWALFRLAHGGVAGAVAVLAWSVAPVAVFTVVPYSESVFLAFGLWAWVRAREGRWADVGLLAAFACLFRITGVFLLGALVILAIVGDGRVTLARLKELKAAGPAVVGRRLAWLALPVATVLVWMGYGKVKLGSWLAWYDAQQAGWPRDFHWPWEAWAMTRANIASQPGNSWIFRAEMWAIVIGLVVVIILLYRLRLAQGAYVGVQVAAFSFQTWFMSVARAGILWFPLFTLLGEAAAARLKGGAWWARLIAFAALLLLSAGVMFTWAVRYYQGGWSG
ncbi:MAG: glycosyltransferase 87 family protein [Propionibacteriaceae bacterium]|nr:glycosyltransferase 87 family protein [Propionibacteriaceae bacterium]